MQRLSLFVWVAVCIVSSDAFTFQSYVVGASIVEKCYDAWNKRNMKDAANCFDRSFSYDDGQYLGKITKDYFIEAQMLYHPTPSWLWIISPNALGSVTLEHNDMWKEMTEVKFLIREAAHFILPTNKVGLSRLGSKSPR